MPKPNLRSEFIAAICDHEQEVRRRLLRGDSLSAVGRWLKETTGLTYKNPVYLFELALPELPELVKIGKRNRQERLEAAIVADRLAGLTYEQIRDKQRTDTKIICRILTKHNLRTPEPGRQSVENSGTRRRYEAVAGREWDNLLVLKLLPRRRFGGKFEPWTYLVECQDCGRRFQVSAAKLHKHEAVCSCGNGGGISERLIPIGAKPDAHIYCRCPSTACVLSEACNICCHECKNYECCKYDCCSNSPDRCGQAAERRRAEEVI